MNIEPDAVLCVIDMQNDFFTGGPLAVPGAERIIPVINRIARIFSTVLTSQCWHPVDMGKHFNEYGSHCVKNSEGAKLHPDLSLYNAITIYKGTGTNGHGLSLFDGKSAEDTSVVVELYKHKCKALYFCGLITEICIAEGALDALLLGFETHVIVDACAALNAEDEKCALIALRQAGAKLVSSTELLRPN